MNMKSTATARDFAEALVINPYYAVIFAPGLAGEHRPSVTEEQWIEANRKLLAAIGEPDGDGDRVQL